MEDNRSIENEKSILSYIYEEIIRSTSKVLILNWEETNFSVVLFDNYDRVIKKAKINGDNAQKSRIMMTIYEQ
jgi:hypothetical protein